MTTPVPRNGSLGANAAKVAGCFDPSTVTPIPVTRDGKIITLPPGVEYAPIVMPAMTAPFITVLRSQTGNPSGKLIDFKDGAWIKSASGAKEATYLARTVHVPTEDAMADALRGLRDDEFIIAGWVPGTEELTKNCPARQFHEALLLLVFRAATARSARQPALSVK